MRNLIATVLYLVGAAIIAYGAYFTIAAAVSTRSDNFGGIGIVMGLMMLFAGYILVIVAKKLGKRTH